MIYQGVIAILLGIILVPSASASTPGQSIPTPLPGQSATVLPDGRWLLLGGQRGGQSVSEAAIWDAETQIAYRLPQGLRTPRAWHSATTVPDGTILIVGGIGADGVPTNSVERFDSATMSFENVPGLSVRPRAFHTGTLLTDGDVLLVGGKGRDGATLDDAELVAAFAGSNITFPSGLITARSGHEATLLPDGTVLVWGGSDGLSWTLTDGEVYEPLTRRFTQLSVRPPDGASELPGLAASIPIDGATDVPVDASIALRFTKQLRVETVNSTTVFLSGPGGLEAARVTAAEGGSLAFIIPGKPLRSGSHYTVSVNGAIDTEGFLLPPSAVRFATAASTPSRGGATGELRRGVMGAADGVLEPPAGGDEIWIPSSAPPDRQWQTSRPNSPWQALPPLKAPAGVTALSGQVLKLDGQPLADVTLQIQQNSVHTDGTGRFVLVAEHGRHELIIDGRSANQPGRTYGVFEVGVTMEAGVTNVLPYTVWMPRLDTTHAVAIPAYTTSDMRISTPRIPGLEVYIPAHTAIRDHEGNAVTEITITPIPLDRPPFPLPRNVDVPIYFTVQPGGAYIYNSQGRKTQLIYPNLRRELAGTRFQFWHYDPADRGWFVYGLGTVTPDAGQVVPDPSIGIYQLTGAMAAPPGFAPAEGAPPGDPGGDPPGTPPGDAPGTPPGPPPGAPPDGPGGTPPGGTPPGPPGAPPADGDPVDLNTGLFVLRKTDLVLPDVIPIVFTRTYRPRDTVMRPFGLGATHQYEMFLVGDLNPYTYLDLILADGGRIHYARISSGTGYADAVYEHTATPTRFYKSRIVWSASAFGWELTLTDGTIYSFPPGDLTTVPAQAALVGIRDRNGNTLTLTRNASRTQLLKIRTQNGRSIDFSYDASNRITQATDNAGRTVMYSYDAGGRLSTVTDPNGGVTEYTYDTSNRMTTLKDPRGIVFLTNEYDSTGKVTRQTQADGTTYQFVYTTDGSGKVTQTDVTNPRGNVRRVTFNSSGYPLTDTRAFGTGVAQTRTYTRQAGSNFVTSEIDALGRRTDYAYDAMGRVLSTTRLAGTASAVTTTATYEPTFNQITSVTDPLNHTRSFGYDVKGNLITITNALGQQTTMTYNAAGQRLTITTPAGTTTLSYELGDLISVTDPVGNVTYRFVDAAGRLTALTDPYGVPTRYNFDVLNRLSTATDGLGGVTQFTYDANGNVLSVIDPRSNARAFTYDSMDRVQTVTDALARTGSYSYDSNGNLAAFTDRKSQVRTRTYDALDRLTQVTYADNSTTAYTWDAGNRLTQVVDSISGTITRAYDLLERLMQETTSQGTVSYTYDTGGRRTSRTVAGQPMVSYSYDAADRLTAITQGANVVSIAYDSAGRRASLALPNGVVTEYAYDAASRITALTYKNGGLTLGTLTYGYDGRGNRRHLGGTWARTALPQAITSATYDATNRPLTFGGVALTHDLNGNLTSDGTTTYAWDARDQLSSLSRAGTTASFQYEATGRRVGKTLNGSTTTVLHDGLDAAQEMSGAAIRSILTSAKIDEYLSHTSTGGETRFALADALGSTTALLDATGAIVTEYTYEPFGATTAIGAPSENRMQYTGRENDGTGLYYYRARYYHPTLQRFISEDPIDILGGDINLYGYVRNNPLTFVDPLGLNGQLTLTDPVFGPPNPYECIPRCTTVDETIRPALQPYFDYIRDVGLILGRHILDNVISEILRLPPTCCTGPFPRPGSVEAAPRSPMSPSPPAPQPRGDGKSG